MRHIQVLIPNENVLSGLHNIWVQKPLSIPPAAKLAHQCSILTTSTHHSQRAHRCPTYTNKQAFKVIECPWQRAYWIHWCENLAQQFTAAACAKIIDSNSQLTKLTFFLWFCFWVVRSRFTHLGNKKVGLAFNKQKIRLKVECEKSLPL
jgi:hypothetical protein